VQRLIRIAVPALALALLSACASRSQQVSKAPAYSPNSGVSSAPSAAVSHGVVRSFDFKSIGDLRVGGRVRIEGNQLFRV
jgi:hypothetical protein